MKTLDSWQTCASRGSNRLWLLYRRFTRSNRGVAILEFALISPFLIALLLGAYEITRYINTARRLTNLAGSIAEIIAQNTTGMIDWTDILSALDSTMVTFPGVLADAKAQGVNWWSDIQISMASVAFTATPATCTSGCTYSAAVVWTYGSRPRPCNTPLTPAPDSATPTPTTLPTDVYGPGSLIVVDVVYAYRPLVANSVFGGIVGPITISRSFYVQPRYVSVVNFNLAMYNGIGTSC